MTVDALDYCLKQLGYRYNVASLKNSLRSSPHISWQQDGRWAHPLGDEAETALRRALPVAPAGRHAAWTGMRDALAEDVRRLIGQRAERLHNLGRPHRFGLDWDEEPGMLMT
ncbi:hypothetical protein [Streptomyces sp. NPDC059063]|uniref:hypothetical protein n=1 Tax=unclassified Streptomyces TaxID=2593676 RepID=UPI0036807E3B